MTEPTCGAEPSSGVSADPRDQALSAGWRPDILAEVRRRNDLNEHTAQKVATHMDWALGYFEARGARSWHQITAALSLEWCWAGTRGRDGAWGEPSTSTARNRRWMLQMVFVAAAALGAQVDPHTAAGPQIKQLPPQAAARPLNDEEDRRVCAFADAGAVPSMRSMVVALSRAGGSAPEIAAVRARHVDMDAQTVFFLGDSARTCTLDPWSAEVVSRYLAARSVAADDLLCVRATTAPQRAAHSVTVQLNRVIAEAGYAQRPDITGRSLRLTAAHRAFKRGGIEAAARLLGSPSLDTAAEAIDYQWHHNTDAAEPLGRCRHLRIVSTEDSPEGASAADEGPSS